MACEMGGFYRRFGKRVLDIGLATIGLVLLSPVVLAVALAIRLTMGSPMIFRQVRPGLNGKPFVLYKSRTMLDLRDEKGNLLPDEKRLTKLGKWLRRYSLDETPELWNVVKGNMSLVGPRPLLMKYLDRYTPEQARRHEVKPGITGWAQVNGRNAITWEEKFKYDVWYVDNLSFWLDIKIIFMTVIKVLKGEGIKKVLKGEGINQPGKATMEEFKGKNEK